MVGQRACLLLLLVLATAGLGGAATVPSHRARVPAPLALRGGSGVADVGLGTVPGAEVKEAQKPLPDVRVDNIAKFNNWDHRECCVGNAHEWKEYMHEFIKQDLPDIPKKIHQIWIGPKQPPIIWCDSWRKRYREQYPGWEYKLWTDKEVAALKLRTQEFYDHEQMFQCKADLLRLEVLWNEGGVYIDADMVWLHKDLQDVLDAGKDTGFFCGYEPDTKDKPYSVIGNSFIACTPKHPLVDMLIKYISAIYHHKRPYHGVEWVTGPLAFTKCISHSQMPWFVPPQVLYPIFPPHARARTHARTHARARTHNHTHAHNITHALAHARLTHSHAHTRKRPGVVLSEIPLRAQPRRDQPGTLPRLLCVPVWLHLLRARGLGGKLDQSHLCGPILD